jgi:hypothetical protein
MNLYRKSRRSSCENLAQTWCTVYADDSVLTSTTHAELGRQPLKGKLNFPV